MRLAVGADHAGHALLAALVDVLQASGNEIISVPTDLDAGYPAAAFGVAQDISKNPTSRGLLVCGTGVGMALGAARVSQCRPVVCSEPYTARMARAHNDANILCLGARVVGLGLAKSIVEAFLEQAFEAGRHLARLERIDAYIQKLGTS